MKRSVVSAFGTLLVAVSVGVIGCEGGGVDPGMPKDTTPGVPLDKMKDMANMANSPNKPPATPPGGGAPAGGTPEPAPKKD